MELRDLLAPIAAHLSTAGATQRLLALWREGPARSPEGSLPGEVRAAAVALDRMLPGLTRTDDGRAMLRACFEDPSGVATLVWAAAAGSRTDVEVASLLVAAQGFHAGLVATVARTRLLEGPLVDALRCAPFSGDPRWLGSSAHAQARARIDILFWEAGASALQLPELGPWLWGSEQAFGALIGAPARGTLRGRVLAARTVETCAGGIPLEDPHAVSRTLQVLQPLLLHPDALVWVHASRAVGRIAGRVEALQGTLLDWLQGESALLRQRAATAFASQGPERLRAIASELDARIDDPTAEATVLGAFAAATPYLISDRRESWERLSARILAGDGGDVSARALARGLGTLWRRGVHQDAVEAPMRALRERVRRSRSESLDVWRRWLDVLSATDPIDGAERDPLDVEQGLENLVRLAAQYDDEESDARAARFAGTLVGTFREACRVVLMDASPRRRAAGVNAVEGTARSLALGLWGPLLATAPAGSPVPEPDLRETWEEIANAPEVFLDTVASRRRGSRRDLETEVALEVLALRVGSYALDACGEEPDLGPRRGPVAHRTCLWLRKVDGLADGARDLPAPLRSAMSALLWRLVDTTRGTALGETDDLRWLGPFAAWWALVIDRPTMLLQLASALPMIAHGALEFCCAQAEVIRGAVWVEGVRVTISGDGLVAESQTRPKAWEGIWRDPVRDALKALHAADTELAAALTALADALAGFASASGSKPDLERQCLALVLAAERLQSALEDPVTGLHDRRRYTSEKAPRITALVSRAIRQRDLSTLGVWFGSLGPVTSGLVEAAVTAAVRRTPPPPPPPKRDGPKIIEGYELLRPLGHGGVGTVWLVRKPGADRYFVLKIPKADALAGANEKEREAILASFVDEARALAGLYHPHVANIIDRGVADGVPFLVLEYLIGADLKAYAGARLMSLFELRTIVPEVCAGLAALHQAGLVHRDIKPANLWLRLPLQGGETFDPEKHRDPARTPPLSTVVIDFGMVRAMKVSEEAVGRFVAGTPGYIAPEQVLDPMELDGRADVYALAGTVYNVLTGRTFFDEVTGMRERILSHMQRDPLEEEARLQGFPSALAKLLRAGVARDPAHRPTPLEFGKEFSRLFA
jgi:tRNA A-37 threonylcarbamoyl transferase component Bud32